MKLIIVLIISCLIMGCTKDLTQVSISKINKNFFSEEIMANIRGYTTQEKIAINVSQTGDTLHLIRIEGASNPSDSTYSLNVLRPFADMVCNMLRSKNGFNQPTQFVVNFQVYSPIWKTQGWDFIENNFYYQVWVSYKDYPCTLDMNYAIN